MLQNRSADTIQMMNNYLIARIKIKYIFLKIGRKKCKITETEVFFKNANDLEVSTLRIIQETCKKKKVDWLIDWMAFYAVSAILQPCNGERKRFSPKTLFILNSYVSLEFVVLCHMRQTSHCCKTVVTSTYQFEALHRQYIASGVSV